MSSDDPSSTASPEPPGRRDPDTTETPRWYPSVVVTDHDGSGGPGGTGETAEGSEPGGYLAIRSFVVRALLEPADPQEQPRWRGQITHVASGERRAWSSVREIARFIEARLAARAPGQAQAVGPRVGAPMAAPPMTDVVADMLSLLEARLPPPAPPLPDPNVTLERVRERLVGLGGLRGTESAAAIGLLSLRGGRLDARVRFQLWSSTPTGVDDAVVLLQGTMLEDTEQLRTDGFLKIVASDTTLAEEEPSLNGWRKTASYDVLYEFQYRDLDDAPSLIARIPINTDPEQSGSPDRETETVTDEMVRWDEEGAAPLVLTGPAAVGRVDVIAFIPGTVPGGSITVLRTTQGAAGPPTHHPDLPTFLAAVAGDEPAETNADVILAPADFVAALTPHGDPIELGDWDEDAVLDPYDGFRLGLSPMVHLPGPTDRFEITYSDTGGLDEQAVLYIRVNAT
jgi:hypothetical protein